MINRRNFISSLIAPVVAIPITVQGVKGSQYQTSEGRYVFHFPNLHSQADTDLFLAHLQKRGFKDPIVICGASSEGFQLFKTER